MDCLDHLPKGKSALCGCYIHCLHGQDRNPNREREAPRSNNMSRQASNSRSNFLFFRQLCLGLSLAGWVLGCFGFLPVLAAEQTPVRDGSTLAQQGIALAQKGRCREALTLLKKAAGHLAEQPLKYQTGMATARCAMSLDQTEAAVQALL